MLFKIALIACLSVLPAGAYELRDVFISEVDTWGIPKLAERKSGEAISGNSLKELYKLYSTTDFHSQKEEILSGSDVEGIIVLCALWAYIVPAQERAGLRNEIIERTLKIDLEKLDSANELLCSEAFEKSFKIDPRLNLFLGILISNRIGFPVPAIGNDVDVHGLEAKASLALRVYMLSVASGDLSDPHFESFKDAFYAFFRLAKSQGAIDRARLFLWIEACELGNFSLLVKNAKSVEEIAERLGDKDPGVRLARALLKKNSSWFESEIISLANSLFSPAYPFMEEIYRKRSQFLDAAFFRYLTMRSPWKLNEIVEYSPTEGFVRELLIPRSEQFFDDLILSKSYDEASRFGGYVTSLLRQNPSKPEKGKIFCESVSRDLIFRGKDVSAYGIVSRRKLTGRVSYINREFELRYAELLSEK